VEPLGAVFLLLFGFGWAKPVPVDSRYFKNERTGMALTSLAGPLANLIAAYLGALVFYAIGIFAPYNTVVAYILIFFNYYAMINTVLAVFNLVPLPPLDGSKILASFAERPRALQVLPVPERALDDRHDLLVSGTLTGPIDGGKRRVQRRPLAGACPVPHARPGVSAYGTGKNGNTFL
jgi:membrane-associated protease RseP (regulator of RpoE activity)